MVKESYMSKTWGMHEHEQLIGQTKIMRMVPTPGKKLEEMLRVHQHFTYKKRGTTGSGKDSSYQYSLAEEAVSSSASGSKQDIVQEVLKIGLHIHMSFLSP
jgi:hypothetical protein